MSYYTLRVCASRGSFEAVPRESVQLDLQRVRERLESAGVPVLDCRVMLIAKLDREVTIGRDGRILIKSRDAPEAERLLVRFTGLLGDAVPS